YHPHPTTHHHTLLFFIQSPRHPPHLHSFPTRRSSDLTQTVANGRNRVKEPGDWHCAQGQKVRIGFAGQRVQGLPPSGDFEPSGPDRKSTRLNSSHVAISYAVFCLKKKKKKEV